MVLGKKPAILDGPSATSWPPLGEKSSGAGGAHTQPAVTGNSFGREGVEVVHRRRAATAPNTAATTITVAAPTENL
jgi:hypothetical protein